MIVKQYSFPLADRNTFGMKVSCRTFIEYDSIADLFDLDFEEMLAPVKHMGAGSNLLFTDDFKGTLLHSAVKFTEVISEDGDDVLVSVGSGVVFDDFCSWAASNGLWGVENLSGIPGETGAAAVQNIGAYGVEVSDVIRTVYCYDIQEEDFVHFDVSECGYAYRDSMFKSAQGRYIVTHVVFSLSRKAAPRLDYGQLRSNISSAGPSVGEIRDAVIAIRNSKLPDPAVMGSAGSFFKNPVVERDVLEHVMELVKPVEVPHYDLPGGMVKIPAAWLIEQCGWKGRRSGNAAVYEKQPLVIVNYTGQASPDEIIALEDKVRASVKQKFGIQLQAEVEHV